MKVSNKHETEKEKENTKENIHIKSCKLYKEIFYNISLYLILYHLICAIAKLDETKKGNRI